MSNPRCIDCEHFGRPSLTGAEMGCSRKTRYSIVNGPSIAWSTNEFERARFWRWLGLDTCGPEGRYFERRMRSRAYPQPPSCNR